MSSRRAEQGSEAESAPATFSDLGLRPSVLRTLERLGWAHPTPIQAQTIPEILSGHDLIGVAQTGTGKTGAFLVPMLERLGEPGPHARALIIEPTRELAQQVGVVLDSLLADSDLTHAVIYGGVPIGPQRTALKHGVDILVATPGRLLDLMGRMLLIWRALRFLVLDEADRMLDMGFMPDILQIMRRLPMARQSLLFTATMPPEIRNLARDHMLEPQEIDVGINRSLADGITEWVYPVREDQKIKLLLALSETLHIESGLIFCRTKIGADRVGAALQRRGLRLGVLHADRPQAEREDTLRRFREGEIPLIVATDVASRGLDISGITHIINFDVPQAPDDYVHRAGRTARADAKGDAITLVSPDEERQLAAIERLLQRKFERSVLADFPYKSDPLGHSRTSTPHRARSQGRRGHGRGRGRGPGHSRNR